MRYRHKAHNVPNQSKPKRAEKRYNLRKKQNPNRKKHGTDLKIEEVGVGERVLRLPPVVHVFMGRTDSKANPRSLRNPKFYEKPRYGVRWTKYAIARHPKLFYTVLQIGTPQLEFKFRSPIEIRFSLLLFFLFFLHYSICVLFSFFLGR